jgi:hypothetical protein
MKQYTEIQIKIYLLFLGTLKLTNNIKANVILEGFTVTDKITGPYNIQKNGIEHQIAQNTT